MAIKHTAWLTENSARERNLAQLGVTVVVAILYAMLASSCGVDVAATPATVGDGSALSAPTVVNALPADGALVRTDAVVRVVFSQAMASDAAEALLVAAQGTAVPGERAWDTTGTVLAFRPTSAFAPGDYELVVDIDATAQTGTALAEPFVAVFTVTGAAASK